MPKKNKLIDWFLPVLDFANAEIPPLADMQDEQTSAFWPAPDMTLWPKGERQRWILTVSEVQWSESEEPFEERRRLEKILDAIVSGRDTSITMTEIFAYTPLIDISGNALLTVAAEVADAKLDSGRLEILIAVKPSSIHQWYAFSLAEFLSEKMGDHIHRCELKTCKRFFLGRPDKRYCRRGHGSQVRTQKKRNSDLLKNRVSISSRPQTEK